MSSAAELTMSYETDVKPKAVREMADVFHPIGDVGASISSGSFVTMGMLILPCSVHTMSEIAYGVTDNLLSRAADVVLKERRRLVIALRETPLHGGHLRTMTQLSDMGAIVAPIVPRSTSGRRRSRTSSITRSGVCSISSPSISAPSIAGRNRRSRNPTAPANPRWKGRLSAREIIVRACPESTQVFELL